MAKSVVFFIVLDLRVYTKKCLRNTSIDSIMPDILRVSSRLSQPLFDTLRE